VKVDLVPHSQHVPADSLALLHRKARKIAVHIAIDRMHEVALCELLVIRLHGVRLLGKGLDVFLQVGACVLVDHAEHRHELTVDVVG
jgi:hypothetical protein